MSLADIMRAAQAKKTPLRLPPAATTPTPPPEAAAPLVVQAKSAVAFLKSLQKAPEAVEHAPPKAPLAAMFTSSPTTSGSAERGPSALDSMRTSTVNAAERPDLVSETIRIVSLPLVDYFGCDLTDRYRRPGAQFPFIDASGSEIKSLNEAQSAMLAALEACHGGLFPVGVGHGKAGAALLAPTALGADLAIILTTSGTLNQLRKTYAVWRRYFRLVENIHILSYDQLSTQSGTTLLEELAKGIPDDKIVIVADECFSGDTEVWTTTGRVRIDQITEGASIYSFDPETGCVSVERVEAAWSNPGPSLLLELVFDSGDTLSVTPNHPFWTAGGWVCAGELHVGDAVVSVVRGPADQQQEGSFLRNELLREVEDDATRNSSQGVCPRGGQEDWGPAVRVSLGAPGSATGALGADDPAQPNGTGRNAGPGLAEATRYGARPSLPGWKRQALVQSTPDVGGGPQLANGVRLPYAHAEGQRVPEPLQDRHRQHLDTGSSGGGRPVTWCAGQEEAGSEEGGVPFRTGLARVTGVERRCTQQDGSGGRVYNLQVSGPRTYLVGSGIVVHNCHKLKARTSSRTGRVLRFFDGDVKEGTPGHYDARFVALSGTITSKSLRDFSHLARLALRHMSPVPCDEHDLDAWAECIDVDGTPGDLQWRRLEPLWTAFADTSRPMSALRYEDRRAAIRRAFQQRLRTCPGVVATEEQAIGCSLVITGRTMGVPKTVKEAMRAAELDGVDPTGEPLPDDISVARINRQLSAGFYYIWDWPQQEVDLDWMGARQRWHSLTRAELLANSSAGYDSEFLVASRVAHQLEQGRRDAIHLAWRRWSEEKQKRWHWPDGSHRPHPPTKTIWVDKFYVEEVVAFAKAIKEPAIIWYESRALQGALRENGIDVRGAGEDPPNMAKLCALSTRAHGDGLNLQAWTRNVVLEPMSSGQRWEQVIGRTHRPGQTADEILVDVFQHTDTFRRSFQQAREDARYIEGTSGNKQKLNYATLVGFDDGRRR